MECPKTERCNPKELGKLWYHTPRAAANSNTQLPTLVPGSELPNCTIWQMKPTGTEISETQAGILSTAETSTQQSRWEHCRVQYKRDEKFHLTLPFFLSKISFVASFIYLHAVFPAGWHGSFSWLNCPPGSWFETRPARASQDSLLVGAEAGGRARRKITIIPL